MAHSNNSNGLETSSEKEAHEAKNLDPREMTTLHQTSEKSESNGQHHHAASTVIDATTYESNHGEEVPPKIPLSSVIAGSEESCIARQPAGQVLEDSRRQKILENLQHRRKLLSWVTASRSACEATLDELSSGKKTTFISEMMVGAFQSQGGESEQQQEPQDASAEKKNFQKISAVAGTSSILKRPKSHGSSLENLNAPTRELRKGANIGKRMTAAVSTLTSNVGWLSSSESSNSQLTGNQLPQSTAAVVEGAVMNDAAVLPMEKTNSQAMGVAKPIFGKRFQPQSLGLISEKATKKVKRRSGIMKKAGHGGNEAPTDLPVRTVQHNMHDQGETTLLESFNPNQPLELTSRASSLIEQRDALSLKIDNLLSARHKYAAQLGAKTLALPTKSTQKSCLICPRNKLNNHLVSKPLTLSDLCLPQQAPRLPTRRKTNWDFVLEEMRWMASDFIGERKWKVATAKILSTASRSQYAQDAAVSKPVKKLAKSMILGTDIATTNTANATNVGTLESKDHVILHSKPTASPTKIPALIAATPLYLDATVDDLDSSQNISHLLSVVVLDHWDTALNKGDSFDKGDSDETCHERFHAMRKIIPSSDGCESTGVGEQMTIECASKTMLDEYETPGGTVKQLSFDEISQHVQSSIQMVHSLQRKSGQQKNHESIQCEVKLNRTQLCAVYFIENLWKAKISKGTSNDSKISAVLGGSFGTGKTVIACSLLWSNRNAGHQLVLCSVGAVMRWKAELNKFHDLKVNVVSSNEWRSSPMCDVSVCDYLTFLEIMKNDFPLTTTLGCLILDLRHSAFDSDQTNQSALLGTDIFEWWDSIIKFVSKFPQSNRLIIEHFGITLKDVHTRRRECDDTVRHCAKLLAMKVAFVYHPFLFYSPTGSTGKRVVSWAKSQKTNIRDDGISALQRIRSILDELLLSVCFTIDSVAIENGVVQDHLHNIMWELRDCPLTPLQNRVYRSHCLDVEGSQLIKRSQPVISDTFSHDRLDESAKPQTPGVISDVLENLHKICIHSNLDEIVTTLPSFQRHRFQLHCSASRSGSILLRGATSETNIEVARSIMDKSGKMKELLSLLTSECGVSADMEQEALKNLSIQDESETGGVPEMAPRKKIVILASLVEAQMLTSFFLSCVGLHHEVFITTGFMSSNPSRDPNLSNLPIAAWNWSQSILSQFNKNEDADGFIHGTCRIIISSPATLSSLNGGICPTSADVVINIDEDWNGREAIHVTSIAKKICCKNQNDTATSSFCKFVKIVCKNTFEEETTRGGKEHNVSIVQHSSHDENDTKCFQFKPDNSLKGINGCNSVKITPKRISSVNSNDTGMDAAIGPVIPLHDRAQPDLDFSAMDHIHNSCSLHFTQIPSNDTFSSPLLTKFAPGTGFALSTVDNKAAYSYGLTLPVKKIEGTLGLHSPSKAPLLVIEPAQTLPNSSTSSPIWHYIQLFDQFSYGMSRSVGELTPDRDGNSQAQNNVTQNRDTGITEKSTSSKNAANTIAPPFNASSLLIYELPRTLSKDRASVSKEPSNSRMEHLLGRKRRFGELQVTSSAPQLDTAFDLNRLILGFSTSRNSVFPFVPDNNRGVEPLVYGPSFLPFLLNTIRNSIALSSSMKRKATIPESSGVDQKRLKFSDPLEGERSTIPQHQLRTHFTSYDEQLIDYEGDSEWFEMDVETNPYSGFVGNEDTDIEFWGRRPEYDAKEIATRQQWPATNSIILVVRKHQLRIGNFKREKKTIGKLSLSSLAANASQFHASAPKVLNSEPEQQPADHDERKTDVKKTKKHQQSLFTAAQDKIAVFHFKKDKPLGRSFAIREGIRLNLAASLLGSVRLRFLLSDALSNSSIHASFLLSQHSSMLQYPISGHKDFGPFFFGERARQNVSKLIRRERSRSGITLPMGVKRPRLARKFTSSLEETDEPWTDKEDTLLQESVAKYGMNWQLASRAVSNFNICRPPDVLLASRRSPNQCQLRWESTMTAKGDARQECASSCDSSANTKILLFPGNSLSDTNEYIVYRSSLTKTPDQNPNEPYYYGPWIRNPNSAPSDKTPLGNSNGAGKSASDRIKLLKETSKKLRVTTTTIPGATTVGNETTVRLVPVHASHREAIQAATSSWPQPRKEMWPMEFLDYTAKLKASPPVVDSNKSTQEASRVIPSHPTRPSSIQQPHPAHPVPYTPAYANVMQGNPPYFGMFPNQHRPHYPPKPPS